MNGRQAGAIREKTILQNLALECSSSAFFVQRPASSGSSGELIAMPRIAKPFSIKETPENRKKGHFTLASKRFICYNKSLV